MRSVKRHALLYAASGLAFVLATALVGLRWPSPQTGLFAGEVLGGIFTVLVIATAFGDAAAFTRSQVVERAFERSWAVILACFGIDLFALVALLGFAGGLLNTFLSCGILLMTATLMFAPVDATVGDAPWWWLLPAAFSRSILVGWRSPVFLRSVIVLMLTEIAPWGLAVSLQSALSTLHVGQAALWASSVATALLLPPAETFATLVYLDAIGYEHKRSCSE